jgi:TonB family protein
VGASVKIGWTMLVALALAPSLVLADPTPNPPPPGPPPLGPPPKHAVISNPGWLAKPTRLVYPPLALRAHVSGSARTQCVVTAAGTLADCQVILETPPGYGFGQAALDMMGQFRMQPLSPSGQSVGGARVIIPFRFQYPGDPSPPLPASTPQADEGLPGPLTPPLSIGGKSYWEQTPQQFARYYPDRAQRLNMSGEASLKCVVTDNGRLTACEIVSEAPEDFGFGQAGLAVSKLFKMHPATIDGRPVGGASVVIRIKFELPSAGPSPAPSPKY